MTYPFPFTKPLVLGHRGACASAPENTITAFQLALDQGADGIELDARLTADGEVLVLHDANLNRVTGNQGEISALTRAQVQRLDAGSHFSEAYRNEHIPALEEVFTAFGARPVYDLEIKNFGAPGNGLERKVYDLVVKFGLQERVIISSFNPLAVRFFRRALPNTPASLLLLGGVSGRLEEVLVSWWASPQLIGLAYSRLTPTFKVRQGKRNILVWGARTPEEVRLSADLSAAVIIVDDPSMAVKTLRRERG